MIHSPSVTADLLDAAADAIELTPHEGCGCEDRKHRCAERARGRRELRPMLRARAAELRAESAHTALVASVGCRVEGCPCCSVTAVKLGMCEWCEQPLHQERDCRVSDVENAEVLP